MDEILSKALVEVAQDKGIDTESRTFEDMYNKVEGVEEKISEIADCDHEDVIVTVPPSMKDYTASEFIFDDYNADKLSVNEGLKSVLRGECANCGKDIDVCLNLEIYREDT